MNVSDVMTRAVDVIHPDSTLDEAAERMRRLDVGPLPVCDGDRLVGMITDRDITVRGTAESRDPVTTRVSEIMTPEVVFTYEDEDVKRAAKLMEDHQLRRLVVLNRDKKLVGIVSLGDLAVETADDKLKGQVLEEISRPSDPER
ncbi:MAG TPA: CBS domain-containing protein [Chloroflexota bacterium]|jgi:CBS domain-containing protein|nr:CBS domain-containing protein [Chloroflexota bacterium]